MKLIRQIIGGFKTMLETTRPHNHEASTTSTWKKKPSSGGGHGRVPTKRKGEFRRTSMECRYSRAVLDEMRAAGIRGPRIIRRNIARAHQEGTDLNLSSTQEALQRGPRHSWPVSES